MRTSRLALAIMLAIPAVFARTARADPLLAIMRAPMVTDSMVDAVLDTSGMPLEGASPSGTAGAAVNAHGVPVSAASSQAFIHAAGTPAVASVADVRANATPVKPTVTKARQHAHPTPSQMSARTSWKAPIAPVKAAPASRHRAALQTRSPASPTDAQIIERLRKELSTKDAEIAALRAELTASRAVATVQLVPTVKAAEHAPAKESPTVIALSASQLNREGMAAMGSGNYGLAVDKFRRAADLNDVAAIANLGTLYLNGSGVPRDPFQALQLLVRAANGGNRTAAENLGTLSEYGIGGVARNPVRAYQWYEVAARLGSVTVQTSMARIKAQGN